MTVAALVSGNCTLLKPAETSCVIAAKLTEILVEAGIPKGVFQYVPGPGSKVGAYLVKHPCPLDCLYRFSGGLPHLRRCCHLATGPKAPEAGDC